MNNENVIQGIHHITAIAGLTEENVAFYEQVLGLRLVKQTVNFDDPSTYHLSYGDCAGNPGIILIFFPWQEIAKGKNGAGMVTAIAFEIPISSSEYWRERILENNVETRTEQRLGEEVIKVRDPSGLELELMATREVTATQQYAPDNLAPNPIIGFHSATATLRSIKKTKNLLVDSLGMELHAQEGNRYRFKMNNDTSRGLFYDLFIDPEAEEGSQGSGSVHHIAFRTPDDEKQTNWRCALLEDGYRVTE